MDSRFRHMTKFGQGRIYNPNTEQFSSLFSCRQLYVIFPTSQTHQLYDQKYFIIHIHNAKFLCINIWSCNYFSQYNIHPYLTETLQMPSISTMTSLRLCTNPICQQRGFIINMQQWSVVQHHGLLTHHMHISSILSLMKTFYHA